ncbi:MAG TPA: DUF5005 domain-containing protein [Streptosporangiaceae bacterium]|nr:DUF5005 domain-containing protein [Streptosporangiaceae bacterium]
MTDLRFRPASVRRTAAILVAAAGVAVGSAMAVPGRAAASAAQAQVCRGVAAPDVTGAGPDTRLDGEFNDYAVDHTSPDDWTGADSTYSAPLGGGRDLWIFSDTFLGTVNPDGSRSPTVSDGGDTPFINNSFVLTSRHGIRTITGGTAATPAALMPPPDSSHWYWSRDGMVLDGRLDVIYSEFAKTGTGPLDFGWYRNVLAQFSLDDLGRPTDVVPLPSGDDVSWGAWLLRSRGFTYIYGTEDLGASKYLHLARVPGDDLRQPWQFLAADGHWVAQESASARIAGAPGSSIDVSNELSVVRHGRIYVLVTQDMSAPLSAGIDLAYSCSPTGPFVDETTAYTTPETGANGTYHDPDVYTYNPHEHPELDRGNRLVISYNVNSLVNTDLYRTASIYRPRFIDVSLRG